MTNLSYEMGEDRFISDRTIQQILFVIHIFVINALRDWI